MVLSLFVYKDTCMNEGYMFKLQESHVIEDLTMAINDNDQQNSAMESHLWSLQRPSLTSKLERKTHTWKWR
jgi:hypothetical protein